MRRVVTLLAAVAVVVVAVVVVDVVRRHVEKPSAIPRICTATARGDSVTLSITQAENASVIAAVAQRRGLPARAVSIALTTALQESKLENLRYGDSDSLGLFQQRPSQGWGKPDQILDPVFAANAFYDALVRVPHYTTINIATAAQDVQHSAYPEMYDLHVEAGRILASALTGWSKAAFTCQLDGPDVPGQSAAAGALTARAGALRDSVLTMFGSAQVAAVTPQTPSARAGDPTLLVGAENGRALSMLAPPTSAPSGVASWGLASFLVAHASALHLDEVLVDGRVWSAGSESRDGWRPSPVSPSAGTVLAVVA